MVRLPWTDKTRFFGLEIEGGYVKLAQAQDSVAGRNIVGLIVKKAASQSQKDIIEALEAAVGQIKGQISHLAINIPHHKVIVRFLSFPTVNEEEIEGMVRMHSAKEFPFSKGEIISDYFIVGRTKEGYTKVAMAIAHQSVISEYLNILNKAGLEPERITFSAEAIGNWYREAFKKKETKGYLILIDLDTDNTDILIFSGSGLVFTRGLDIGTDKLGEHDLKNKLAEEIKRTIEGYRRQEKTVRIEKIFLSGGIREKLRAFLEQRFSLPCEIVGPLKNLSCQGGVSVSEYKNGPSLVKVLGTVLDTNKRKLNLLPVSLRRSRELKSRKKGIYTTLILCSGIILLGLFCFAKRIYDKQLYIRYLDRKIKENTPLAQEVEGMLKKIELIENRREMSGSPIDILRLLYTLVSENIWLSSLSCSEENGILALQGMSTNMSEIFEFVNKLKKTAYFKNVELKYAGEKKSKTDGFASFEIKCILGGNSKEDN